MIVKNLGVWRPNCLLEPYDEFQGPVEILAGFVLKAGKQSEYD